MGWRHQEKKKDGEMARLTNIENVLFPVQECPVYTQYESAMGKQGVVIPGKKALVNARTGRVLGVVGREYVLVKNQKALDLAYECCARVFPETRAVEWVVDACDAPSGGGHCFIDLRHHSTALDFSLVSAEQRPDTFGPFIRVTNSYNGLRALSFDIGFYRKVCKNGLISPRSIISFSFIHSRREIGKSVDFKVNQEQLKQFKSSFSEYIKTFRDCFVPQNLFKPLVQDALRIIRPAKADKSEKADEAWKILSDYIDGLCRRYADELGENAYAVFNAVTDFASHPPSNSSIHRDRNSLQKRAGEWINKFHLSCKERKFQYDRYFSSPARRG